MTGISRTSDGLDTRRRRVLYRAWHRGTRELDLLVGRFAEAEIETLTPAELDVFERLMEAPETDLFPWITGQEPIPAAYDTQVLRRLVTFAHSNPLL